MCKSFIVHLHSSSLNFPLLLNPSIDCVGKSTILLATETTSCVWEAGGSPGEHTSTSNFSQWQGLSQLIPMQAICLSSNLDWTWRELLHHLVGCSYTSHGRTWTRWLMWSGSRQVRYGRRWTNRRFWKWLHKQWRENRRHTRGWRRTASCSEQKTSTPVCMRKPLDYHAECTLNSVQQI